MASVMRVVAARCFGIVIDVQSYFLAQVDKDIRSSLERDTADMLRLFDHLRIPMVVTLEQPLDRKGGLPATVAKHAGRHAKTFEKNYFDLTKEAPIRRHLARLQRKQAIVAGCETDVCVLQSVLGLLQLGFEVFVIEDLLFSSTTAVEAAIVRMKDAGAVFLTNKTLFYELTESVDGCGDLEAELA